MEALLGVVLVAQLPSKQPEVVFKYPSVDSLDEDGRPGGSRGCACSGGTDGAVDVMLPPMGTPSRAELISEEREHFGVPSIIFAKLMLPDEELCNRPFYLEIDAGRRETSTSQRHEDWSHLLFVSFPCNVAEFSRPGAFVSPEADAMCPQQKVQRFNIVHVLDSRLAGRREKHTSTLWQVSAHIARALVSEEARVSYLSREVQRLLDSPESIGYSFRMSMDSDAEAIEVVGLDHLLIDAFEGVRTRGYSSLRVNGCILCQVCVFPKHETPAPPSAGQALALTCSREELQQELPMDCAEIVRCIVDAVDPATSLGTLMVRLALPLGTLQRVAQHLVHWKKARVVEVFLPTTRVAISPGVDTSPNSGLGKRFTEWQIHNRFKAPHGALSFAGVVSAFSGGQTVHAISEKLRGVGEFKAVLEWMIAQGLVFQLATFYHFLPKRAKGERRRSHFRVDEHELYRELGSEEQLPKDDMRLLSTRATTKQEFKFLCRFAVQFARAGCRADGSRFVEMVESFDQGRAFSLKEARRLLDDNDDIFVRYVCQG